MCVILKTCNYLYAFKPVGYYINIYKNNYLYIDSQSLIEILEKSQFYYMY